MPPANRSHPSIESCKPRYKKRDEMYANRQHDIGNGWLVFTCSNTPSKKRQIEAIAKALNINVKVEIV